MLTVRGLHDDIVEVSGDRIYEEFEALAGIRYGGEYIAFSDGTVLLAKLKVSEDSFHFTVEIQGRNNIEINKQRPISENEETISDIVTLEGEEITWAVYGFCIAKKQQTYNKHRMSRVKTILE